ncbi:dolichyl-phosphate-mannose-protein mannosyltransferase [Leptospira fainei serovar Hurstbridge str. BUT 6]|uniref:Dolichyl-phosphate-mannose-protein mannosyltransferase n=1 Tax=Leptospira fainei serovar Hurstbridge str. BUT 6 TaxID=1193011 RepID=S3VHW6_9LEPT|nr:glycosyltransferase family 39 protein [Leptospira fainei]EPG76025.1 dolichyl-phosphate-mannose-protein mannosyltransferase [Leptospira fainei serovar Hurstbridge str. BUT 6]
MKFRFDSVFFLLSLYFLFLILGLGSFPLIDWDENIYGAASKGMFVSGDFFRITVNGQLFTEKPPLYFWLAAISYFTFGLNEFGTRFPSVLSAVLAFGTIYFFGKRLRSSKFGIIWALLYSSSLLPLVLARTAYIDHLFNTFIFLGAVGLCLYDTDIRKQTPGAWKWLIAASASMALAVLAKGPLGLCIPVASFIAMRIFERRFQISIIHTAIGAVVFIGAVSVYYLTDYLLHGEEFLQGFLEFQRKLLTKSLESHTGPWFYHFIAALIGFFPWTPFLFAYISKGRREILKEDGIRQVSLLMIAWTGIVLIIFSIVQTKLPHYSSSIYFPLSFFTALVLERFGAELVLKKWIILSFLSFSCIVSVLFLGLPILANYLIRSGFSDEKVFPEFGIIDSIPGLVLLAGILFAYFRVRSVTPGDLSGKFIFPVWVTLLVFLISLSVTLAPKVIDLLQGKTLRLFDRAVREEGGEVIFYKYLSFYPMFYRDQPIHIVGSYKFKDESDLLNHPPEGKKLFIIGNANSQTELIFLYPNRKFVPIETEGGLVLLRVL